MAKLLHPDKKGLRGSDEGSSPATSVKSSQKPVKSERSSQEFKQHPDKMKKRRSTHIYVNDFKVALTNRRKSQMLDIPSNTNKLQALFVDNLMHSRGHTTIKKTVEKAKRKKKGEKPKLAPEFKPFVTCIVPPNVVEVLTKITRKLTTPGHGIFAADDSIRQITNRFMSLSIYNNNANRRSYHELFVSHELDSPCLKDFISGVMFREEAINQGYFRGKTVAAMTQERDVLLGIRFDTRLEKLHKTGHREFVTPGLESLEDRIANMKDKGIRFGLWRVLFVITEHTPTRLAVTENTRALAKFAVICQQNSIVPILAADVLEEGGYDYDQAANVLKDILTALVDVLLEFHVVLKGTLIRINPAKPGPCFPGERDVEKIAMATMITLNQCLPPAFGGVMLAREETLCKSIEILNQMQMCRIKKPHFVTFCYSKVIQDGCYDLWAGQEKNKTKTLVMFMKRAKLCHLAAMGSASVKVQVPLVCTVEMSNTVEFTSDGPVIKF